MIGSDGHGDRHGQGDDAARRVRAHVFLHRDFHACQIDLLALGDDAHDCGHAGAESGSHQIRGRKRLAASVVIDRSIGDERVAGGHVQR